MDLKTLSIATFNLYNLNLPGLPLYTDSNGWSEQEYERKIAWTASQLKLIDADVVGFQELWHGEALTAAVEAAGLGADYDVVVPDNADGKGIVCASIVRRGLLAGESEWIADFPEDFVLKAKGDDPQTPQISVNIRGFSRPVLHFAIRPRQDEPAMQMYVCHLKSKQPTRIDAEAWYEKEIYSRHAKAIGGALSTIRRTAEAAALRFILTNRMKGNNTAVVVMGDINDGQLSNTANILTEQPAYLVGDSVGGGDIALYTAQTLQEYRDTRDVYYTHVFQDFRESLDHILVSEQLYDNSRRRRWLFDGLIVNNDHLNFNDHKGLGTNDHGIIRAVFRHRPIRDELE
ncbi:endonuclease/exonuclease/phosphatase family protein [Cupriavidus taiwanensis]|uniref:Extracellular nuclease n=1 Tax=Cupriavidus taiwanensis TaxID=164546 RepID=A0A375IXX0_9BURK|nr:endonuclease/exonuclease/phosphatase family protein [Cupriavidus taiwanensis]SPR96410.1 Extracellular nuclease [Cupriavidus taiwanensis]